MEVISGRENDPKMYVRKWLGSENFFSQLIEVCFERFVA